MFRLRPDLGFFLAMSVLRGVETFVVCYHSYKNNIYGYLMKQIENSLGSSTNLELNRSHFGVSVSPWLCSNSRMIKVNNVILLKLIFIYELLICNKKNIFIE